jgi:hypothetical protein
VSHRRWGQPRLAALAAAALLLAACSDDRAAYPHTGQSGGWAHGSFARIVLLYVLVPIAISVVISALVLLPEMRRRHRYRPQEGWSADPVWFAGPPDPVTAVAQAQPGDLVRGGAGGSW